MAFSAEKINNYTKFLCTKYGLNYDTVIADVKEQAKVDTKFVPASFLKLLNVGGTESGSTGSKGSSKEKVYFKTDKSGKHKLLNDDTGKSYIGKTNPQYVAMYNKYISDGISIPEEYAPNTQTTASSPTTAVGGPNIVPLQVPTLTPNLVPLLT
jgi:hypothetical protein